MTLMEVSKRGYDMIHCISGLYGYLYVCEIYVNLIWYMYLFMLNIISESESGPIIFVVTPLTRNCNLGLLAYLILVK